jgi:hypothetical protein
MLVMVDGVVIAALLESKPELEPESSLLKRL